MSDYKGHSLFNLMLFLPITLGLAYYFLNRNLDCLALYAGSFVFGTLLMSPDADIARKVKVRSLRGFFLILFRPYSRLFKHRGVSHWVIIGTLTRVAWLFMLFSIGYTLFYQRTLSIEPLILFCKTHKEPIYYSLGGLCLADIGHLLLDH
jgi:uncharacterized metal-binding protein